MKINLSSLTAIMITTAALASCGGKDQNAAQQNPMNAPVPVTAYTVSEEQVVGTDSYPATIVPLTEVELRPQVSGYITKIYVQDGQLVKKGQQLYEIDRTQYQATYNQVQANLRTARANLERVRQDLARYENLAQQDAIARQRVDYARADFATAQAQVASAQAGVSGASTNLRYSIITAPITGRIGISQVRYGSQVSPGQTLLNTISNDNPIAVDFVVPADQIPRFTRLQLNKANDSTFTVRFADGSVYPFTGKVETLDRAVDPQTGTLTVRISFPNPNRQLIPGMSVVLLVRNADIGRQLVIPNIAITEQMGEFYTYVISGDSVTQNRITLGSKVADKIVVREGLKAGDKIVVEGTQKLRPGAKVVLGAPQAGQRPAAGR